MARTGEKYTKARRAIEEIQATPPAEVYKSTSGEPYYFVDTYDHTPYGPYGNVLAYADETDDKYEGLLSADRDGIEWETLAGKTQIATGENSRPRAPAFSRIFPRVPGCARKMNLSGRLVHIGFAKPFSPVLRS